MTLNWACEDSADRTPRGVSVLGSAAAGLVHDLNNELTLILNLLSTGRVTKGDIEAARGATVRCGVMTSNLLTTWNRDSRRTRHGSVDASAMVAELARSLSLPKTVHFWLDDSENPPAINADPAALRRILHNLILNACQAMNYKGALAVGISKAKIIVADTGPGIAPTDLPRIFEPYFTTKGAKGNGLGLSVVKDLMRQQGGTVTVESEPGCTMFELCFRD